MTFWRRLRHLWAQLVHGRRLDHDLDAELQAYLELDADERVRRGEAPEAARRRARLAAGSVEAVKEDVRDARRLAWLDAAARDLRYGLRQMRRAPAFTAAAVLSLALGIGATTATFSVVDGVLLRPLAYRDADALVLVGHARSGPVSPQNLVAWRARTADVFATMGAAEWWAPNLRAADGSDRVFALRLTPDVLPMLGVPPALGRLLRDDAAASHEVVVSHGFWQRRLGADPAAVGRTLELDGATYTVVGVMPAGFQFAPFWATRAEIWAPLPLADRVASQAQSLRVFARRAPGVTLALARDRMTTVAAELERAEPGTNRLVTVTPLKDLVVGDVRQPIVVLFGAVVLVLVIASVNVAHLLLARAFTREREVAVRQALGAGRGRLARQFLTESLLLAVLGGAAGVVLAQQLLRVLVALAGESIPRIEAVTLDARVLGFAVALSVVTGVAFGLAPLLRLARPAGVAALRSTERGATPGRGSSRGRGVLVASEVALALTLFIGAGLMIRSFAALRAIDPGWVPDHVLTLVVSVAGSTESAPARRTAFYEAALAGIRALPGVEAAGAINHVPIAGDQWSWPYEIEGRPPARPEDAPSAVYRVVLPGYFDAMQLPVARGRAFTDRDALASPPVVIVNEALAAKGWPGESAIGRRMRVPGSGTVTVVGVAKNAVRSDWTAPAEPEMYLPYLQSTRYREDPSAHLAYLSFVVRGEGEPATLVAPVSRVIRESGPDVTLSDVRAMPDVVADATRGARFMLVLLAAFAGVALVLAAVGIYGVLSYVVAGRRHEIGIRLALGASRPHVLGRVLGQGLGLTGVGIAAGLGGGAIAARAMAGVLFGVPALDPLVFAVVPVVLALVAGLACLVPAWRASRVDPVRELR
ncbi:MAG: ABC transporter permease [Vicinamibacterales bacterium]